MSETPAPTRPRIPDDVISSWATNDMDLFLRDFALDLRDARADSLALREALKECADLLEGFRAADMNDDDEPPIIAPAIERARAALLASERLTNQRSGEGDPR